MSFSRRNFLRLSGSGLLLSGIPTVWSRGASFSQPETTLPFHLGIASYTFRDFSLEETIAMTQKLNIGKLCLKSMHMPLDSSEAELKETAGKVKKAGIDLYGAGVIYMTSREEVEQAFAYAGYAGLQVIIGSPEIDLLGLCDQKVKETGIRLAIHNHGPGDEKYPSPESVYNRVRTLDPGMGLCVDIGHTTRIGLDPTKEVARFMDRVFDIHLKDEDRADENGNTCEIGRGIIDIPGFLKMLIREKYSHVISFEFEKDEHDPLPGLAESVGYVRGVLKMVS